MKKRQQKFLKLTCSICSKSIKNKGRGEWYHEREGIICEECALDSTPPDPAAPPIITWRRNLFP